jgi:hypothetical protein
MTTQRSFGYGGNKNYSNIFKEQGTWCSFIVDSTNGNGLGTRSLKSNGHIEAVFMHTSATPGKSPGGFLNPNPPAGYVYVLFKSQSNVYLGGFSGQVNNLTSTSTTSLTANNVYVITSLGTTTTAQWQTAGVPMGFTPAIGTTFIAAASASLSGTGTVGLPAAPVTLAVTAVGDPNQLTANSNIAQNGGSRIMLMISAPTSSSVTTMTPTAPANGTVIGMKFCYDTNGGSNTIDGL